VRSGLVAASIAIVAASGCSLLTGAAPAWVTDRVPLESCGTEETERGLVDRTNPVRVCLLDAFRAGRGAEMISTTTTMEGDPITSIVRVHPDGLVEVFIDNTRDRFGSGAWERLECTALVSVPDANDPPNLVHPDELVFVQDSCEQVPAP